MSDTIHAFESAGIRDGIKIIVGGAPITTHFADQIGADGYANDGGAAIRLCCQLLEK
jgi:5-methyltetrahydrofolate--homocysteine methyltransferase